MASGVPAGRTGDGNILDLPFFAQNSGNHKSLKTRFLLHD